MLTTSRTTFRRHEKGLVTRSEMKVLFDDDKKILEISTPAGKIVTLDEDNAEILKVSGIEHTTTVLSSLAHDPSMTTKPIRSNIRFMIKKYDYRGVKIVIYDKLGCNLSI